MMDGKFVLKLSLLAAGLGLAAAAAAYALSGPKIAAGILVGGALGATTFLSWVWVVRTRRGKPLAMILLLPKLGIYALVLYATRDWVDPIGLFLGVTIVAAGFTFGSMSHLSPAGEEAR